LSDLGYDPGPIDGIYGEKTYNAVKVFESKNGMTVDGVVDTRTWSMLFSADPVRKQ
jgi:peptidoglycan hydrolase-like protein with peptidoglycan-binding domain